MAKKDIPSAVPPTLHSYDISGQLKSLKALREADAKERPPQAEYARGSTEDRGVGNKR